MSTNTNNPTPVPQPAQGFLRRLKWALPFLAVFLPIVLLGVYAVRTASESTEQLVETENRAATDNIARLLTNAVQQTVDLVDAFATVPGTVDAVQQRDLLVLSTRLKAIIVSYPQIDRAFVFDASGVFLSAYPTASGAQLQGTQNTPWSGSVSDATMISGIYDAPGRQHAVFALAAPVRATSTGSIFGTVVFEFDTANVAAWLKDINLSHGGYLYVLDHRGAIVAHPRMDSRLHRMAYADLPEVQRAFYGGDVAISQYRDPLTEEQMLATFLPISVGGNQWLIVAQQPTEQVFAPIRSMTFSISLVGVILSFFTLLMVIALARLSARNIRLNWSLQQINHKLREIASIVRSSNDAIIGHTVAGIITSWNTAAEQMYGYKEQEMIGKGLLQLVPDDQREAFKQILSRVQGGEGVQNIESVRLRKDGTTVPVALTMSPVEDEYGVVLGASSIDRDITERKQIEQMKSDFISFVSHQLKAPVTAIRWMLEEILDGDFGEVSPQLQEALKEMEKTNTKSFKLIANILNVSRIERGVIEVTAAPVSLRAIVEQSVEDYRKSIEKAGLLLILEGLDHDVMVLADRDKMAESVSNSVSNAIKHTKQGGITVRMKTDATHGIVEVADTGEGMPPEMVKKLFTRDQILGGSAGPEKSAGLGLYIAENFMRLQGGEISVRTEQGKGTTFTYRIPLDSDNNRNSRN